MKNEETYLPSESLILLPMISGAEESSLGWATVQGILTKHNGVAISIGVVLASGNCIVTLVGQVTSPFACS
jgi:hypothetical protein